MTARPSKLAIPLPWYPWYPLHWRANRQFQRLTLEEKGLLRELVDDCYLNRTIPAELDGVAHLLAMDASEIRNVLPQVMEWFEPAGEGLLSCPWIEEVRADQDEVRQRQSRRRTKGSTVPGITVVDRGIGGKERTDGTNRTSQEKKENDCGGTSTESGSSTPTDGAGSLSLPCDGEGKETWPITNGTWRGWQDAFPNLDLANEVSRMADWLRVHLASGKPPRDMQEFAARWLKRSQESLRHPLRVAAAPSNSTSRTPGLDAEFLDQLRRSLEEEDGDAS